jgi:hypothetical protein
VRRERHGGSAAAPREPHCVPGPEQRECDSRSGVPAHARHVPSGCGLRDPALLPAAATERAGDRACVYPPVPDAGDLGRALPRPRGDYERTGVALRRGGRVPHRLARDTPAPAARQGARPQLCRRRGTATAGSSSLPR